MKRFTLFLLSYLIFALASCTQQPTAEKIIAKVIKASGGAEKLVSIHDQITTWDFTMQMPMPAEAAGTEEPEAKTMTMTMVCTYKRPNKLLMEFLEPDGNVANASCYNGESGWTLHQGQLAQMDENQLKSHAELAANWVDGFLNYQDKGYTATILPSTPVEGTDCFVIKLTDSDGKATTYYIDSSTYYMIRFEGEMLNFQNQWEPMYMTMRDYKMVDGIALAHYVGQFLTDGTLLWEATLKDIKHNTGVDDSIFYREITMK